MCTSRFLYAVTILAATMQVAVKELSFSSSIVPGVAALELMWHELKEATQATLDCRHICRLHGIAVLSLRFLIVMPLYQGSLAAQLRCTPGEIH